MAGISLAVVLLVSIIGQRVVTLTACPTEKGYFHFDEKCFWVLDDSVENNANALLKCGNLAGEWRFPTVGKILQ